MLGLDAVNSHFLVVAMAALLVAVLVWQPHRNQRTVVVWLASGAVGVVLGSVASYAGMKLAGYSLAQASPPSPAASATASAPSGMGAASSMQGMGKTDAAGCPLARGFLTSIVRKLDLLTSDIGVTLTAEQAAGVSDCLRDVETPAKMSNSDAKAKYHRLVGVLSADQKARLAAIGLPQPGSDGPAMGPGAMAGMMASKPDGNPPTSLEDADAKAFRSLRERFAPKGAAPKAETPKAQQSKPDAPKSPAVKP